MADLPLVYLARHGETAWTVSRQHTGRSDIPLTEKGERNAVKLGQRLKTVAFARVFSSPSQRARKTCELAGFADVAQVDLDTQEWDYGRYDGLTSVQILKERPDWQLFRDGCPDGETVAQIGARADRVLARLRSIQGNALLFSSGHFLRVLAARWLGLDASGSRYLLLSTASLSVLGYEHNANEPVLRLWNDDSHVL
ncbi:MAG: histidine phosphatase family protein [Planctomycetes bacterium]|nr:histidine phosphatase family protein [Planctomycetota bacterium]